MIPDLLRMIVDLPWRWIAAAALLLAAITGVGRWRRNQRRRHHAYRSDREQGSGSGAGQGNGAWAGGAQTGEQRALLTAANQLRDALERQTREMGELRTFWSQRLDELNGRIGELVAARPQGREGAPDPRRGADLEGHAGPYDAGMYGAGSLGMPSAELAWSPGPGDQPVEIRDGVLVASRSLPPAGYLATSGPGPARVYLNADVQLTEFSLPKWAAFFELQGARPYAAYRTRRPAEVRWDEAMGRGELVSKGLAEAI